ncbi:MAG: FCD domain-containing protein, partial [Gammaproteobacteria bacterium]|nr:FCD domain-containing protein [Gammaproteobacteria bacterium]
RLFSLRADPSQIYYLEITVSNLKEILSNFDPPKLLRNDLDFHRTIARGSKNVYMQKQHEIILEKVLYIAQTLIRFGEDSIPGYHDMAHYEDTYKEHERILEAVKSRDPDEAERAARASVQAGLRKTLQILAMQRQSV